jgi:type IV pilus assembly protein PilQ
MRFLVCVFAAVLLSFFSEASASAECRPLTEQCAPDVTLELKDAELRGLLGSMSAEYGINMVISPEVEGTVNASIRNVPLFDALDSILESRGYVRRAFRGGQMLVEPASAAHLEERSLVVREFPLRYVNATDKSVRTSVAGVLSSRGSLQAVTESNSLVVKDISIGLERAAMILGSLDRKPRQVVVEARVIEIRKGNTSALGIAWGGGYRRVSGDVFGGFGSEEGNFSVNLPAVDGDMGGSIGFAVVSDRASLDLKISALEETGEARTVSSPRVQVMENRKAMISDGEEILVPSSMSTATVVQTGEHAVSGKTSSSPDTFRASLELSVIPRVVEDSHVALALEVRREWFDQDPEKRVDGYPPKISKLAATDVILEEGTTVAIGGIETEMEMSKSQRVPFLSRIPLLGWLFKNRTKAREQGELLIFLTPRILDEDVAGTSKGHKTDL